MLDLCGTHIAAIFAHPDDEAFSIGGTLAAFTDRNATVTLISATRGEEGEISRPYMATRETLGQVREQELRNAASVLGVSDVRFLDYRDSGMSGDDANRNPAAFIQHATDEIARKIIVILEDIRPAIVITFSEDGVYLHPDHIHIHKSVVEANRLASNLFPHLYFVSAPREHLLNLANQDHGAFGDMPEERRNQLGQPLASFTHIVDVSPYYDRKFDSFRAHQTQQPKEGEREFLDNDEARRKFGSSEYYIRVPGASNAPDPLARLAADLPGSSFQ